jgi:hypothetical protein
LLNINAPIVGASAAIMAILVATTTIIRWWIWLLIIAVYGMLQLLFFVIDLMQLRSENMGTHFI